MIKNFYAEHNTDKFIRDKYFSDYSYKGVIMEVGAATPTFLSTTKHFKENGWRAIHIEPNPIFVEEHLKVGNEIYNYACGEEDKDNVDFTVISQQNGEITCHSFSSFFVKDVYQNLDLNYFNRLDKKIIKVNCRKLDSIIKELNLQNIDILSIDTEGWELEVMRGLSIIKPTVIILENVLHSDEYNQYMENNGYKLDDKVEINYIYIQK